MVDAMDWDYREPSYADIARYPLVRELLKEGFYPKIYELWIQQEAPDAEAEIMVNYTAIFDGTSTAAVVYYDSSDAKDTAAGVGVRTIQIIGTDEAGTDVQAVTDSMAGQTGTATGEKWNRLWAFKSMTAGSEGDAAGTVTVQDDAAGTNKHMTMAAGDNCSISARIYPPTGWKCCMYYLWGQVTTANVADGELVAGQGALFSPIVEENTGVASDHEKTFWALANGPPVEIWDATRIIDGDNDNYLSLQHVTKADDDNQVMMYRIVYVLWNAAITARGFVS